MNKPHRFIALGCCRKKQVVSQETKVRVACERVVQGFNLFGHCLLLVTFILSLILIVGLIYWMVSDIMSRIVLTNY